VILGGSRRPAPGTLGRRVDGGQLVLATDGAQDREVLARVELVGLECLHGQIMPVRCSLGKRKRGSPADGPFARQPADWHHEGITRRQETDMTKMNHAARAKEDLGKPRKKACERKTLLRS